jgi:hypothetical protein
MFPVAALYGWLRHGSGAVFPVAGPEFVDMPDMGANHPWR